MFFSLPIFSSFSRKNSASSSGLDSDGDGILDGVDSHPNDPTKSGVDADNDGLDDAVDPDPSNSDIDGDGILDGVDSHPNDPTQSGVDADNDGIDDAVDPDPTQAASQTPSEYIPVETDLIGSQTAPIIMSMEVINYSGYTGSSIGVEIKVLDTRDFSADINDPSTYPLIQVWSSDSPSGNFSRAGSADLKGWSYSGNEYEKYTKEGSLYTFTFEVFGTQGGNEYYNVGMYGTSASDLVGSLSNNVFLNVDTVGNVYKHEVFSSKLFSANTLSTKHGDPATSSTNFYAEYTATDGDSITISTSEVRYIHSASSTSLLINTHVDPPHDIIIDGNGFSWGWSDPQDTNFFFTSLTISYSVP